MDIITRPVVIKLRGQSYEVGYAVLETINSYGELKCKIKEIQLHGKFKDE